MVRPGAWTRIGVVVTSSYAVLDPFQAFCEHIVMAPVSNGDNLLCYRLPVPCDRCWGRFFIMVLDEMENVLDCCQGQRAFVYKVPASDDVARSRWHNFVGARVNAFGQSAAAFVVEVPGETRVVATHGLWGGAGRMLRQHWAEVPVEDVWSDVAESLAARLVTRGEMFYRNRFYEHLFPLGQGEWGIPLLEAELVELVERVRA